MMAFLSNLTIIAIFITTCNSLMIVPALHSSPFSTRSRITASQINKKPYRNTKSSPSTANTNILCLHAVREATFGMGCFWGPSEAMRKIDGVVDTVVGYAGGSLGGGKPLQPPTYDDVCYGDTWVESVMVAYDDEVISYESLLDSFWEVQAPREGDRQYQSFIFPSDELQFEGAQRWLDTARESGQKRASDGLPFSAVNIEYYSNDKAGGAIRNEGVLFYRAEDYHQEFWKKWRIRIGIAVFLLSTLVDLSIAGASTETQSQWTQGTLTLLGVAGFYYGIVERIVDDSVQELLPGAFAARDRRQNKRTQSRG